MAKTIAFMGIDGAGKTTLINEIEKSLRARGETPDIFYMGLGRDIRLPLLKHLMGRYSTKRYNLNKSKSKRKDRDNYRPRSSKWLLVYSLELFLRYFLAKFSRKKYVLFDRYFYDGLVFSSERDFRFLKRLFPRPDKCFLIYAPAKIIRSRKKEAPVKDITKFYERMDEISKHFNIEKIDNTRNLNLVKNEILEKINGL